MRARIGGTLHGDRPDLPGIGMEQLRVGQKPALPAPLFLSALRRLAEAGEVLRLRPGSTIGLVRRILAFKHAKGDKHYFDALRLAQSLDAFHDGVL